MIIEVYQEGILCFSFYIASQLKKFILKHSLFYTNCILYVFIQFSVKVGLEKSVIDRTLKKSCVADSSLHCG